GDGAPTAGFQFTPSCSVTGGNPQVSQESSGHHPAGLLFQGVEQPGYSPEPVSRGPTMTRANSDRPSTPRSGLNRRGFLRPAAAAAVALGAPAFLRARDANSKLNLAIIGVGGRGGANLQGVASENIVALCDVFQPAVDKAAGQYPKARQLTDYRKLYDHASEFDAVVVSTCEHTHAFATLPALQLGKHVYCENPLTYNIAEARVIRDAAA